MPSNLLLTRMILTKTGAKSHVQIITVQFSCHKITPIAWVWELTSNSCPAGNQNNMDTQNYVCLLSGFGDAIALLCDSTAISGIKEYIVIVSK